MTDLVISEDSLLEHVDEYLLYCHYLGFEPDIKVNYSSPLRDGDDHPSFALFTPTRNNTPREYMWKDSALGSSGDIFALVQRMFGLNDRLEAMIRIRSDFNLGKKIPDAPRLFLKTPVVKSDADIRIKPRKVFQYDFDWWQQWNITQPILDRYRVSPLSVYWIRPSQVVPMIAPQYAYVYRIYNQYQLYFPQRPKGGKFMMDLKDSHVLGTQQLDFSSDTLIITKSYKDVMTLRSLGYEAISPRSENVPLPQKAFPWINSKYKKIFVLFDNDGKHRAEWYPYPLITIPLSFGSKDISDFVRDHSPNDAKDLMRQLLSK